MSRKYTRKDSAAKTPDPAPAARRVVPGQPPLKPTPTGAPSPEPAGIVVPTTISVARTVKLSSYKGVDEDSSVDEEIISVHKFATAPAMASVTVPVKMARNYQSIGLEIRIDRPCYMEELPGAVEEAYTMALDRVRKEIPDLRLALERLSK